MPDIRMQPYALWLEGVLQEVVEQEPVSIAILTMQENGTIGSAYYGTDNSARALFGQQMLEDSMLQFISINAKYIHDLLSEDEEGDDAL